MRYVLKILHVVFQEVFFGLICLLTQLIKPVLYFTEGSYFACKCCISWDFLNKQRDLLFL